MVRKLVLTLIAVLGVFAWSNAQSRRVSGTVYAPDGTPAVGVSVLVDGTTQGTTTDVKGAYSLNNVPANGTLTVSFVGYETQTVPVGNRTTIDITLQEDNQSIDDVIVVAYGTTTREANIGSVGSVKSAQIEKRTTSTVTSALEGSTSGVQVNSTYGEPGTAPEIRIRGFGSLNGSNAPLYVVDGTIFNGSIADINPADIASINVLKDAASAALYGNRAANGVILITTKRGATSKLNVQVSTKQGVYTRGLAEYDTLGANDWMEMMFNTNYNDYYQAYLNRGLADAEARAQAIYAAQQLTASDASTMHNIYNKPANELFDENGKIVASVLPGYTDLNWFDGIEQTGYRGEYNIQADVAGDRYDVFASLSYLNEDGYIKNNQFERFSARVSGNFKANKWFKTGLNLSGTSQYSDYQATAYSSYYANPFYSARMMAPIYPMYLHNDDGSIVLDENGDKVFDTTSAYLSNRNIAYELQHDYSRNRTLTLNGSAYATFTFLKDFDFTIKGSLDRRNATNTRYNNPEIGDGASNGGRFYKIGYDYTTYTFQQQLTWGHNYGHHHIDLLAGHENFYYNYDYSYMMKVNQMIPIQQMSAFSDMQYMEGYDQGYRSESYLGRARYNYDNRYFIEGSYRRDGSSRFAPENRWGNFWSIGGSWMISNEQFMANATNVNFLKLRASYGEVGNDRSADYYAYRTIYEIDTNNKQLAVRANQMGATDLKWETTQAFDIGVDARFWDRLDVTVDYFNKKSKDLIYNENLPQSAGTLSTGDSNPYITRNFGSVKNYGLEINLNADLIRTRNWRWDFGVNATFLKNKVKQLPKGEGYNSGNYRFEEGHSMYEFYMYQYAGVDQMTGLAMYELDSETYDPEVYGELIGGKYYTNNTTYALKDWSGCALPTVYGGFSTNLTWKNLTLNVLCSYSLGGKVYDSTYRALMYPSVNSPAANHTDLLNAWKDVPQGMTADSPNRLSTDVLPMNDTPHQNYQYAVSNRWLQSASYLVIKNIGLTYDFPKSVTGKMGIGALSVSFSVENPLTVTSLKGMNPQYSFSGGQDQTFVTARIYTFGLNLKL